MISVPFCGHSLRRDFTSCVNCTGMKRLIGHLYFWVLLAIVGGGILGYVNPAAAVKLKPLADGFIPLVKMLISLVIFCTVLLRIAAAGDMQKVRRVRGQALRRLEG